MSDSVEAIPQLQRKNTGFWKRPYVSLLAVPVLFFICFLVVPQLYMLAVSFFKYQPMKIFVVDFTFENYARFVSDPFYRQALWYTLLTCPRFLYQFLS